MKLKIVSFFLFIFALNSCKDDSESRLQANAKNDKKNEEIFASINKAWDFNPQPLNPDVQKIINNWSEWRLFMTELDQKPKSSIGAFQQKSRTLSKKVTDLSNNIPAQFDKPEIRARIMTLSTKIKSLDLYINLDRIQEQKVLRLIPEVNSELASLQTQMSKLVKVSQIRLEEGEAEMLRSLGKDSIKNTSSKLPSNSTSGQQQFDANQNPKAQQ